MNLQFHLKVMMGLGLNFLNWVVSIFYGSGWVGLAIHELHRRLKTLFFDPINNQDPMKTQN